MHFCSHKEAVQAGNGSYYNSSQIVGAGLSQRVVLADIDGDTDLDAFIVNSDIVNSWWRNTGGVFGNSGQAPGTTTASYDVALVDVDGDTFPDAFIANHGSNEIWFNNGSGLFTDSGQALGSADSEGVALGDLDNDQDPDIVFSAWTGAPTIWINQGNLQGGAEGDFQLDATLSSGASIGLDIGDVDNDNDVDIVIGRYLAGNEVWLNQGGDQGGILGAFANSGQADPSPSIIPNPPSAKRYRSHSALFWHRYKAYKTVPIALT